MSDTPDPASISGSPDAHQAPTLLTPLQLLVIAIHWRNRNGCQTGAKLSINQVNGLFAGLEERYPPILTYEQAADLVQVAVPTLKGWFSQGKYANCVKRNKPGRVVRDLFVQQFLKDEYGFNVE